ncbi:hypothetical protein, variant [Aphanomyces astaci]|uniref:PX domain-containing protein n=1 Tax=Aphanomyces astaci TaxID=112090 RepID=W4GX88_APHAT|nr:hypothetical protein H257_03544 [Aphanomyces astaci]XP_009825985.1 hypothetical protein, variant [Aphanomyces astaci]ETV84292.1 hypothetical protein H257_03544 [Aphanomyces astaci]ETV84293.1 hypothetical protein, variant [Aphanomyces astaci]|eukprot:XP_009825984.1 hypothetical protein H257_03544 [Aphanomyces astaci]
MIEHSTMLKQTVPTFLKPAVWSSRYGDNFYTLAITGFVVQDATFAEYTIQVKCGSDTWIVNRRFREFVDLWNELHCLGSRLPELPAKSFLCFRDLSHDYLSERRRALEECLWDLLQLSSMGEIDAIKSFLDLIKDDRY